MRLIDADAYIYSNDLKNEPTIEAEPVRHGEWLHRNNFLLNRTTCSECGVYFDMLEVDRYCPNCGAKMDGKEKKE